MKKVNILVLFAILLCVSCSKDDVNNEGIIGEWTLTKIELTTPLDTNNDGVSSLNLVEENPIINGTLNFLDELNGSIFYTSTVTFNSRIEDGQLIFMIASSVNVNTAPKQFTYIQHNNSVSINEDVTFNTVIDTSNLTLENDILYMNVERGFVVFDIDTQQESIAQDVTYIFTKE